MNIFKSRKNLYLTIAILIFISLVVPFLFNENILDKIGYGLNFISVISTVITLYIALMLFNKFGVERNFLDKQFDTVVELIGEVKKIEFKMEKKDTGCLFFNGFWKEIFHSKKELDNQEVLFDFNYFEKANQIADYTSNIYLPKEISSAIEKIKPNVLMAKDNADDYWIISVKRKVSKVIKGRVGTINYKVMTYKDFYENWEAIILECKKWLKNNSSIDLDLNC